MFNPWKIPATSDQTPMNYRKSTYVRKKKMIKLQASEATDTNDIDNLALRYRKHTASRNRGQIP